MWCSVSAIKQKQSHRQTCLCFVITYSPNTIFLWKRMAFRIYSVRVFYTIITVEKGIYLKVIKRILLSPKSSLVECSVIIVSEMRANTVFAESGECRVCVCVCMCVLSVPLLDYLNNFIKIHPKRGSLSIIAITVGYSIAKPIAKPIAGDLLFDKIARSNTNNKNRHRLHCLHSNCQWCASSALSVLFFNIYIYI